jgi:protease I
MVIAKNVFRDEEYLVPRAILEALGTHVRTASDSVGACRGKLGAVAYADLALRDVSAEAFGAIVFVGGAGAQTFFDDPEAHRISRGMLDSGKVVAAICIAPSVLARAGLLEGVRATAFASQESDLRAHGAIWTDGPVEIDGRIITANGPEAADGFGNAIADALGIAP